MSALPHEHGTADYANPYRLEAHEGPQTPNELRAALAVLDPALVVAFNAEHGNAAFNSTAAAEVIARYRHIHAARTRPEVTAAVQASLDGTDQARPVEELWAFLDARGGAA